MYIEIIRAKNITLIVNGVSKEVKTDKSDVEDLLKQEGIEVEQNDDVIPSLSTLIKDGMTIDVRKYTIKYETNTESIPCNTIFKNVTTLNKGEEELESEGKDGIASITYKIKYLDGVEAYRVVVDNTVLSKPTDRVVLKGVLETFTSPEGKTYKVKQMLTMNSTAYTNSLQDTGKEPGHPLYGITRTGMKTQRGVVAVDPKIIPLKSKLYVEGYGEAIAADTGSAIIGHKIDLFYDTREEALKYGRKNIKVYVLCD